MHHPGPPRFLAVGESVQLAPRDPNPEASYRWRVQSAPLASQLSLGEGPVVDFAPDAAGTYAVELDAPDGSHELTLRVFPGDRRPVDSPAGESGASGPTSDSEDGPRAERSGDADGSGAPEDERRAAGGRPRVRLDARIEGDVVVFEADPRPNPGSAVPPRELDVEFLLDDRDGVDRERADVDGRRLRVPTEFVGERLRVHAVAVGESYSVADAVAVERTDEPSADSEGGREGRQFSVRRLYDPPSWATDATLYEVYVRGFADDEGAGNTFDALEERLPYLDDLGVDCLWLTPVLQHDGAPHGYNITDFFAVADDLGTREDYESFVEAAHDRGMKVLFDLVLNHSARDHPHFQDAYGDPDSEYRDWYEWQESGEPGTYFDWELIANFDHRSLEVRRYLLDAVDEWAAVADGFRCDMAWAVPDSLWREVRDRVKERDEEFLLLDETIPYIADFHEGMFDVHFDTTLYFALRQVGRGEAPASAVLDAVDERAGVGFPDHAAFMLYMENHDETRYLVECGDDAAFAAAGALFTLPGIPMLYAGQEIGQRGTRDPIAWDHARPEVREHYEALLDVHHEASALSFHGDLSRVDYEVAGGTDGDGDGDAAGADADSVVAFARETRSKGFLVVLNFGAGEAVVGVDREVDPLDLVSGESCADENGLRVDSVGVFSLT